MPTPSELMATLVTALAAATSVHVYRIGEDIDAAVATGVTCGVEYAGQALNEYGLPEVTFNIRVSSALASWSPQGEDSISDAVADVRSALINSQFYDMTDSGDITEDDQFAGAGDLQLWGTEFTCVGALS